ncbi:MAG: type II toxin-antitoxin system RelE/ParE family toxin [Pirellulaceae bacterium]
MTRKPVYTEAASTDLIEILEYVASDKPMAAATLIDKLEEKCLLIASSPEIGQPQPELGYLVRSSIVGRYIIFYRHGNDRVEILRVIPGDRDITRL